jgi:hypothetical protein
MAIYRYKACEPRALAVFNTRVSNPVSILDEVRSGRFDPQQVLLLEEKPEPAAGEETHRAETNSDVSVRFTSYQADEAGVEASLPRPGFLLLLDTYFPGWTATVNGQPTKIYQADYNFRAVPLPAGKSTVHFYYRPKSFRLGLALSATGWLTLVGAWFWSRKRQPVGGDKR